MKAYSNLLSRGSVIIAMLALSTSVQANYNHPAEVKLLPNEDLINVENVSPAATLQIVSITPFAYTGGVNIRCWGQNTGRATVLVSGGTAPYTYSWSGLPYQTGPVAIGMYAGTYTVIVTDATGSSVSGSVTLIQNPPVQAIATPSPILCNGGVSNVVVTASGGTTPISGLTSYDVIPGIYYYTVADANGCRNRDTIVVTEPPYLDVTASSTPINCYGDISQVTVAASGGTAPYTGVDVYNQAAGSITYIVTDANGCFSYAPITITEPSPIQANVSPQNHIIDCIPQPITIDANPIGAIAPCSYLWSDGSTGPSITVNPNMTTDYSVAITDANGCTVNSLSTVSVLNRCGNNNNKILICHVPSGNPNNAQTICISQNALNTHLSSLWNLHEGDYCGECGGFEAPNGFVIADNTDFGNNSFIRTAINTNTDLVELSYRLTYDSQVRVEIYDMTGTLVEVIHENSAIEGELYELLVEPTKFTSGVYVYQFITNRETHIDRMQFVK